MHTVVYIKPKYALACTVEFNGFNCGFNGVLLQRIKTCLRTTNYTITAQHTLYVNIESKQPCFFIYGPQCTAEILSAT